MCSIVIHLHPPDQLKSGALIQLTINKRKVLCIPFTAWKKISKNDKNAAFWPKMSNSQQVCIWINKDRNDRFRSNQKTKVNAILSRLSRGVAKEGWGLGSLSSLDRRLRSQAPLEPPPPHEMTLCTGVYEEPPFWVLGPIS